MANPIQGQSFTPGVIVPLHMDDVKASGNQEGTCGVCYVPKERLFGDHNAHAVCENPCLASMLQRQNPPKCYFCASRITSVNGQPHVNPAIQREIEFARMINTTTLVIGIPLGYMSGLFGGSLARHELGLKNSVSQTALLAYSLGTFAALAASATFSYRMMEPPHRLFPGMIPQENYFKVGATFGAAFLSGISAGAVIVDGAKELAATPLLGLQIISEVALQTLNYSKLVYRMMNELNHPLQRSKVMVITAAVVGLTVGLSSHIFTEGLSAIDSTHSTPARLLGGASLLFNLGRLAYRWAL